MKEASATLRTSANELRQKIQCEQNFTNQILALRKTKWRILHNKNRNISMFNVDLLYPPRESLSACFPFSKDEEGNIKIKLPHISTTKRLVFGNTEYTKMLEASNESRAYRMRPYPDYVIESENDLTAEGIKNANGLLNIARISTYDIMCFNIFSKFAKFCDDQSILVSGKEISFLIPNHEERFSIKLISEKIDKDEEKKNSKKRLLNEEPNNVQTIKKDFTFEDKLFYFIMEIFMQQRINKFFNNRQNEMLKWHFAYREPKRLDTNMISDVANLTHHFIQTRTLMKEVDNFVSCLKKILSTNISVRWIQTRRNYISAFKIIMMDFNLNVKVENGKIIFDNRSRMDTVEEAIKYMTSAILIHVHNTLIKHLTALPYVTIKKEEEKIIVTPCNDTSNSRNIEILIENNNTYYLNIIIYKPNINGSKSTVPIYHIEGRNYIEKITRIILNM